MYMPAPVTDMLIYRRNFFFFLNFTLLNYLLGFL